MPWILGVTIISKFKFYQFTCMGKLSNIIWVRKKMPVCDFRRRDKLFSTCRKKHLRMWVWKIIRIYSWVWFKKVCRDNLDTEQSLIGHDF